MNSGSAPICVFFHHLLNCRSDFRNNFGSARILGVRSEMPEKAETGTMPGNNGFWFNNDKSILPSRPKPVKQDPKQSISASQSRALMFSIEHAQLLA